MSILSMRVYVRFTSSGQIPCNVMDSIVYFLQTDSIQCDGLPLFMDMFTSFRQFRQILSIVINSIYMWMVLLPLDRFHPLRWTPLLTSSRQIPSNVMDSMYTWIGLLQTYSIQCDGLFPIYGQIYSRQIPSSVIKLHLYMDRFTLHRFYSTDHTYRYTSPRQIPCNVTDPIYTRIGLLSLDRFHPMWCYL